MGGHYDKSVYNQLMEAMERPDKAEERHKKGIYRIVHKHDEKLCGLRNEISELKGKVKTLEKENSDYILADAPRHAYIWLLRRGWVGIKGSAKRILHTAGRVYRRSLKRPGIGMG